MKFKITTFKIDGDTFVNYH